MHHEQTILQGSNHLLLWLNSHTHSFMKPINSIASLGSGVVYLLLLSKLNPSIEIGGMIFDPTEHFEAAHNFRIIASIFQKIGLEFPLKIAELAAGSQEHNTRLLAFIRDKFEPEERDKRLSSVKLSQPIEEIGSHLIKDENMTISDQQISNAFQKFSEQDDSSSVKLNNEGIVERYQQFNDQINHSSLNSENQDAKSETICDQVSNSELQQHHMQPYNRLKDYFLKAQQGLICHDFLAIAKLICSFLQSSHILSEFQDESNSILKNYQSIANKVTSLDYLFYGSCKKEDESSNEQKARKMIREACLQFFQSTSFIRRLIQSCQSFVRNKVKILESLPNIIRFAIMKQGQQQITSSNLNLHNQQCLSVHKRTLIAYQLLFMNKKLKTGQQNDVGLNQKGFLFEKEQTYDTIPNKKIIRTHTNTYSALHQLFQVDKNQKDLHCLKILVFSMLQFKGKSFIRILMDIYDCILQNIKGVQLQQANQTAFLELVDKIVERIKSKAQQIDAYLVNKHRMKSDIDATLKLLRVTVYCFLAEKLSIKFNPFHQQTKLPTTKERYKKIINTVFIQSKCKMSQIQVDNLVKQQIFKLKNEACKQKQKKQIICILNTFVTKFIQQSGKNKEYSNQIKDLFQSAKSISRLPFYLQFLFTGKTKISKGRKKVSKKITQITQNFAQTRTLLERMFKCYSQSFQVIVNLIYLKYRSNGYYLILLLKLLPRLELLPDIGWNYSQFFTLQYQNQTAYRRRADHASNQNQKSCFWSDHKIVLIAIQSRYTIGKKYKKILPYNFRNTTRFSGLLLKKKNTQVLHQQTIQQIAFQYKHLNSLFKNKELHHLSEFVIGMLQLKNTSIIDHFLHAYNFIIGEIVNVELSQVYHTSDRFRLINQIAEQLQDCGKKIDHVLVKKFGFATDLKGTMKLLRLTVYCFLGEMHSFSHNQFYCEAFNFEQRTEKEENPLSEQDQ